MLLPILQVNAEELSPYAIVCGDPFRAEIIASRLDNAKELAFSREYRTFVGESEGVRITVVSHGVGSPGAAVCFEELIKGGVKTLIRVGTAGSYSSDVPPGSLIVSTAAVREEGLTKQLVPHGFPAVADLEVVSALYEAASETEGLVKKGITVTLDAFFQGVVEFPHRAYKQAGALAVEMEIAALYVIASLRGVRAGAIVALDGYADADLKEVYNPHTDVVANAVEREIQAAIRAIVKLHATE
ncbi:nucleoside phosphorylase [Paenibacillus sp. SYP-B3998]|uniref:Uridine phosphorylase n=1 Tax=Paenibacillus sp. SYP-B3998 TaxID=2678564 RepID=A0A6G3ZUA5_9BACL|nr:nucleoside phosphorylase [Paenibacillus sp. SYP-B3998]NEW04997.1 nucleoside phosphorylase [Paenibacillus sp. SYP-B3998]